jgi:hypothetical protein
MKFRRNQEYVDTPHGNFTVWRYMAHWKLESLIRDSSLYFSNAKRLTDQYEVTVPDSALNVKRRELMSQGLKGRDLEEEMAVFHWETDPKKELVLANCWSLTPHESYALWKIYLGGEKNGVAIRSTVSSLRRSLEKGCDPYPEEFFIGKVKYRTHLKPGELARLSVITTKKPFYDFEKELRVFICNYPLSEGGYVPPYEIGSGRTVNVDLAELVHSVYVSPFADSDYMDKVAQVVKGTALAEVRLRQSEIRDK